MSDPSILDSRASWMRLGLALLVSLIGNAGMWAIILMLPDVQAEFGASRAAASLPYTAMMIGFALGNVLIGRAVDRFGLALARAGAGIGCCVAMAMPQVHIVAYSVDLGYGPAVGGEMLSLMLLGGVASRLVSGLMADKLGGVVTLLIGSTLQMLALFLYLPTSGPTSGLTSLYLVSMVFGLSQGGIVPSYAMIVREYFPAREAGARVGFVIMSTIIGMALGGWLSGVIYDVTGSYQMAFLNGIAFNALNVAVMVYILMRSRPRRSVYALAA